MKAGLRGSLLSLLLGLAALLYFVRVPAHPAGFAIDESSICYNAYTISQTGHDEYDQAWPLFFRAFGEYKNPTIIYLLAALFRITGPSIALARTLTAVMGLAAGLLLGALAWQMTRRSMVTVVIAISCLLTPWFFESCRLVFEVAIYPGIVVLFLIVVWRCSRKARWQWQDVFALAVTLALLTYSYSIGRLLGPLLAVGLLFFLNRERAAALLKTWIVYALLLVPLLIFHLQHPGALTGRFQALTYLRSDARPLAAAKQFVLHYAANLNPWRWLVTGEDNVRDHLHGTGALLAGTLVLSVLGLFLVSRQPRRDAWWRFVLYGIVVSIVPASLTNNPFPQLRLVAFPVFVLVLAIPAVSWLADTHRLLLSAAIGLTVVQGIYFQWLYHREAPKLWYVFDARFPRKILAPALAAGIKPVYLLDERGKAGYIHALWYGALLGLEPGRFVRAAAFDAIPPGSIIISTEEDCRDCRLIARALNYIVYSTPPYPDIPAPPRGPLPDFRANIAANHAEPTLRSGETAAFDFAIKNLGKAEWPALGNERGAYAVKLVSRWLGKTAAGPAAEKRLPFDVEPEDTVGLTLQVTAPAEPGEYVLEVDLVQEQVGRFSEHGSRAWTGMVQILPKD
jgi:hypothetical protein